MHNLSNMGFLRLKQIIEIIPISESTWWSWVREGKAPQPVKLSERITTWRAEAIHELIEKLSEEGGQQ